MQNRKDKYFQKAKREGYLARSAYKLLEINKKYNIIKAGDVVLDLGCSPGSWTQVCLKLNVKRVIGVDIDQAKIEDKKFKFIEGSFEEIKIPDKFDVVLSDVAPSTSGHMDAEESIDLTEKAFEIGKKVLKKNGNFVAKVFQGKGFEDLIREMRKEFGFFKISKPKASRKESREIYLIGKGLKQKNI